MVFVVIVKINQKRLLVLLLQKSGNFKIESTKFRWSLTHWLRLLKSNYSKESRSATTTRCTAYLANSHDLNFPPTQEIPETAHFREIVSLKGDPVAHQSPLDLRAEMSDDRMKVKEHVAAMRSALGADLEANSVTAMNIMTAATKMTTEAAAADGAENEAGMDKLRTDLVTTRT